MKKVATILLLLLSGVAASAQNWELIKEDTNTYLWGEGWAETLDEADQQALASLISKISIVVVSDFEMLEGENASKGDYEHYVESKISTFSQATLTNTEMVVLSNEPDAHVGRWIKRSEIDRIFEGRRNKVMEFVENAERAEGKGKVDDALRNYYWAYSLLKTLQHPSELKYMDKQGTNRTLVSWIPAQIDEIMDDIKPVVTGRNGDELEIFFSFRNKPVASLDYTYFDGSRWSNLYSAKDGKGVLELSPGALGENIQIKYEYAYKNEAHIDKELYSVINVVKSNAIRSSYANIKGVVDKATAEQIQLEAEEAAEKVTASLSRVDDETDVRNTMDDIMNAITSKNYAAVNDHFTQDGLDIWNRLISYGKATLVGKPAFSIYKNGDRTVVRALPMSFQFKNGIRKSFVEDIVFTFTPEGKIDNMAFALDEAATNDVLNKGAWPENARISIIEFLENYKTAFALERLDYIRTIFDDNAVIIVGKVAKTKPSAVPENNRLGMNQNIVRTRYSKEQYLKQLERSFASKEFINIRFSNNDIIKAGKGGEIYGIQIKQDYYSNNYGDTGYLFLLVDINSPVEPIIKVRTWQPEPDPVDGLYDISDF